MLKTIRNQKGFTIIELLIVIAIIAILATLVLTNFRGAQAKGRDTVRQNRITSIYTKLEEYYNNENSYPGEDFTATLFAGIDSEALSDPDGNDIFQVISSGVTAQADPFTAGTKPQDDGTNGNGTNGSQFYYGGYNCTADVVAVDETCGKYVLFGWSEAGTANFTKTSLN